VGLHPHRFGDERKDMAKKKPRVPVRKRKTKASSPERRGSTTGGVSPSEKIPAGGSNQFTEPGSHERIRVAKSATVTDYEERLNQNLVRTVIALPLLDKLNDEARRRRDDPARPRPLCSVIIDLNLNYSEGREAARTEVQKEIGRLISERGENARGQQVDENKSLFNEQYVFAKLEGDVIRTLVEHDGRNGRDRKIYQIWEDFPLKALITSSISTVKADAAKAAFSALGKDIVWAVIDSGIKKEHPHFDFHQTLRGPVEEWHYDFTGGPDPKKSALADGFGHGTHVAGIIAGEIPPKPGVQPGDTHPDILAYSRELKAEADPTQREVVYNQIKALSISGMAAHCKLVSLKVLDAKGEGSVSNIIAAIGHIQKINSFGRYIRIHGVNLSVGYPFEPEWFACGQSQLCVEVDRLVRSGVTVVVAAGNSGYGVLSTEFTGLRPAGMGLTINDPGNADLAITVGSTHRNMPHIYGVSYFSSKGPTGDGRLKPDLVAPGEKILSCAAGSMEQEVEQKIGRDVTYLEHSGTSMAAPHVSGIIAAFLSVRREFIGQPERIKQIFVSTATDLRRERYFQGAGLADLMRAIQSV